QWPLRPQDSSCFRLTQPTQADSRLPQELLLFVLLTISSADRDSGFWASLSLASTYFMPLRRPLTQSGWLATNIMMLA
ncbi:MAG: hypothetical protein WBM62_19210, partial [Crocosphaera sp.]